MFSIKNCSVIVAAGAALSFMAPAEAALLSEVDFSGGTVGQTLAANPAINGVGMAANFDGFVNSANSVYVPALSGSLGSSGNAIQLINSSARFRMIIDRTTANWLASGTLENPGNPNTLIGADGSTLYGSILISNPSAAVGFTGLEFAAGDPNSNRVITLGEAAPAGGDFVVLGSGQAGGASDLALPAISPNQTREIVFRIDYGAGNVDTFTLINPDLTDGASGTGNFTFSTLHLAGFSGTPAVTYDDIRLGTTLADVTVPEPASLGLIALGGLAMLRRR